ncbi:MAG: DUF968 domain-containing protein [Moraxellaceae bacterium]|nr:DUF968 domain-containing protein [Moraxellaceae bacterium]
MTARAERAHMGRVASLPCACCGQFGVQVHHIRDGQGMAQRASNFLVVPLREPCHTGKYGVHGDKSRMRARKQTELDWLADTIERLA